MNPTLKDQVVCIREGEWIAVCDGKVIQATFNSRGAALAGIAVEKRRRQKKLEELH